MEERPQDTQPVVPPRERSSLGVALLFITGLGAGFLGTIILLIGGAAIGTNSRWGAVLTLLLSLAGIVGCFRTFLKYPNHPFLRGLTIGASLTFLLGSLCYGSMVIGLFISGR